MMNKLRDWLWISDRAKVCETPLGELGITQVVTACQDETHVTDAFFPVEDGLYSEDNMTQFGGAVDHVIQQAEAGETLVVHCHAGISRSAGVCVAAICAREDVGFEKARWEVRSKAGTRIAPEIKRLAQRYLRERREREEWRER